MNKKKTQNKTLSILNVSQDRPYLDMWYYYAVFNISYIIMLQKISFTQYLNKTILLFLIKGIEL